MPKKNCTLSRPVITLPSLDPVLQLAQDENRLIAMIKSFVHLHREHLLRIQPNPTKAEYKSYCSEIVEKYEMFAGKVICPSTPEKWVNNTFLYLNIFLLFINNQNFSCLSPDVL